MNEEKKNEMKKKSIKMTFKIIIKRILGIPHSLTGLYVKLSVKVLKFFKKRKNEELDEGKDSEKEN